MQHASRRPKIAVSADGKGIVSGAGDLLLAETLRVTGLGGGLSRGLARWRPKRAAHDPGNVADLAVAVALGGGCLADIAVLRARPELCGPMASDPVVAADRRRAAADPSRARVVIASDAYTM